MNFDSIDQRAIQGLVDAGATESAHLEFKRETYGKSDRDKKEFLKDISSFANSLGGHLIIGVEEKNGAAVGIRPCTGIDVDQELQRLESIIRTGLEPAIIGLRMKRVMVEVGDVIVVHIPRSYNPPHRVIYKNSNRYFSRSSSGVYELSLEELRMHFGQQRSIEERAKAFVNERFLRFQAKDAALPVPVDGGAMIMHLVPLPDFGTGRRLEIAEIRGQQDKFRPIGSNGHGARVNLDGVTFYRGGSVCHGYTHVFRDGSIEATSTSIFADHGNGRYWGSLDLPKKVTAALSTYLSGLKALDASPPILLQISFLGMKGVRMGVDTSRFMELPPHYEREELHLSPTIISEYQSDGNYERFIAEQMDFLWNAYGFDRCDEFDEDGNWIGT